MTKLLHIYAFGSLCRGEVSQESDIDLLAVVTGSENNLSKHMFSIYSHKKIDMIWKEGNPFAWHLHHESRLIHSSNETDFIGSLGPPAAYAKANEDCRRFIDIFRRAAASLQLDRDSAAFDLSAAFLGLRNFSTCYLLGQGRANFSRHVALTLLGRSSFAEESAYRVLERARLLCTRGYGTAPSKDEINAVIHELPKLEAWMERTLRGDQHGCRLCR
jgi:hypothetical protein